MAARNLIPRRRRAGAQDDRRGKLHREELSCTGLFRGICVCLKSVRAISTGQLQRLLAFHPRPINVVVSHDPSLFRD
jgi:hypothetical protein